MYQLVSVYPNKRGIFHETNFYQIYPGFTLSELFVNGISFTDIDINRIFSFIKYVEIVFITDMSFDEIYSYLDSYLDSMVYDDNIPPIEVFNNMNKESGYRFKIVWKRS